METIVGLDVTSWRCQGDAQSQFKIKFGTSSCLKSLLE